jgi:hypothetical protein
MEAGRELDALVATNVMGWTAWASPMTPKGSTEPDCWRTGDRQSPTLRISAFEPSTDIDDAWLVVEAMRAKGWLFALNDRNGETGKPCWCEFADVGYAVGGQAWEADWPLAICRAALHATTAKS